MKIDRGRYQEGTKEAGLTFWKDYEGNWTINLGFWSWWIVIDL